MALRSGRSGGIGVNRFSEWTVTYAMRHRIFGSLLSAFLFVAILLFRISAGYEFQHLHFIGIVFLIAFPIMTVFAYFRVGWLKRQHDDEERKRAGLAQRQSRKYLDP